MCKSDTWRSAGQGPFTYEALRPEDIVFQPLKQERSFNARELLQVRSCQTRLAMQRACLLLLPSVFRHGLAAS